MTSLHEHFPAADDVEFSFDRETLDALLVRHPWAFRLLAFEALVLSIAGVIPLFGESSAKFALFGMLVSIALLSAMGAGAVGLVMGVRHARRELANARA